MEHQSVCQCCEELKLYRKNYYNTIRSLKESKETMKNFRKYIINQNKILLEMKSIIDGNDNE